MAQIAAGQKAAAEGEPWRMTLSPHGRRRSGRIASSPAQPILAVMYGAPERSEA
jgi:hypothetical protein